MLDNKFVVVWMVSWIKTQSHTEFVIMRTFSCNSGPFWQGHEEMLMICYRDGFGELGKKLMAHSKWGWDDRPYEKWSKGLEDVGMQEWMFITLENPPTDHVSQEGLGTTLFYKGKAPMNGSLVSLRSLEVAVSVGGGWWKGMFKNWFPL